MKTLIPAALALLASTAAANVYVVDDNGGAGVDFTDLPAAIAVAGPLDVIVVRPGNYTAFVLSRGVSILADSGAIVTYGNPSAIPRVLALPANERAVVSGLTVYSLIVEQCAGPVLVDQLTPIHQYASIRVDHSLDVRLRSCTNFGVNVDAARVEVTSSTIRGAEGPQGCVSSECDGSLHIDGYPGSPGIECLNGGSVHVSQSSITGGRGGEGGWLVTCPNGNGGPGGPGVRVASGGTVLLTGVGGEPIAGGAGGLEASGGFCAPGFPGAHGASAIVESGSLLYSNVVFVDATQGTLTQIVPADPVLRAVGTGIPGTTLSYTVHGIPGDSARLRLGRRMVVEDLPNVFEDRLTVPLRSYLLGILPPSGQATFSITVPGGLPAGFVLVAQGSTTTPSGETRLTQSAPIPIR